MIGLKRGTVQIVSYQPGWRRLFEEEAVTLRSAVGCHALEIEHVGSTAIEGMDAKPIIDIIVAVDSLDGARELVPIVEALGYTYKKNDDVPGRVFFVKGPVLATWLIRSDSWRLHGQQPSNWLTYWSIRKPIWSRPRYD